MTIAVKLLLTVALIFSIAVPFGAFAAGEKTKGRYKTALAANTVMFFGTMLFAVCVLFNGTAFAAESTAAAGGISTGMGYIGIAVMTGVVMCLLLLVYAAMSFGRRPEEEKELKITIPENLDYTGLFDDLFAQYTRTSELVSVRTTGMGSLYNLHYHVTLVSSEVEKQFLDAIRCRNGNLDIVCGKVPQAKEAL